MSAGCVWDVWCVCVCCDSHVKHHLVYVVGCLRNGAEDIKGHRWFGHMDWEGVYKGTLRTPFKPDVCDCFVELLSAIRVALLLWCV